MLVTMTSQADPDFGALWDVANPADGLGPPMAARWHGYCRGCGSAWDPGDLIRRDADEDGYLGMCCGDDSL